MTNTTQPTAQLIEMPAQKMPGPFTYTDDDRAARARVLDTAITAWETARDLTADIFVNDETEANELRHQLNDLTTQNAGLRDELDTAITELAEAHQRIDQLVARIDGAGVTA